jgi:hypothetical protein
MSGNKLAMESRASSSLLDKFLCHSSCLGCQTRKEYKDFPTRWMLDSGASAHFTSHLEDFSEIQIGHFGVVQTASKLEPMLGQGNVLIEHLVVDKKTGVEHVCKTRLWLVFYF